MQLRSVAGETHAARTGTGGDHDRSPGKSASRINFFHVCGRPALQRLLPAPAPAARPSAPLLRCRGPAPSRAPRAAPTWPGQRAPNAPLWVRRVQPSSAALSVPPPRCSLGLAPADPQGRGREQTRVGGAGAEAEGRAQREEAAEPRSPGRPLPHSIPASGRRAGRGRRSPASGGEGPAGPGRVWVTRDPREGVPSSRTLGELSECGSWIVAGGAGRTSVRGQGEPQAEEWAAVFLKRRLEAEVYRSCCLLRETANFYRVFPTRMLGCLDPDILPALKIHFPMSIMAIEAVLARVKGIQRGDPPTPLTTAPKGEGQRQIAKGSIVCIYCVRTEPSQKHLPLSPARSPCQICFSPQTPRHLSIHQCTDPVNLGSLSSPHPRTCALCS